MSQPVDVSKLSPEEKEYYEKYGMLPKKNINQMLHKRIEGKQHFDSADWAKKLSAAKSGEGAPAGAPAPAGARPAALKGKQFSHLN